MVEELEPLVQHTVSAAMKGQVGARELANVAYGASGIWKSVGVGTWSQQDEQLFKAVARMAERRLDEFSAQALVNTAWAFATVGQQDEQLFNALARMAEWHLDKFSGQALANAAWAFAIAGAPVPALLDPSSLLDMIGA